MPGRVNRISIEQEFKKKFIEKGTRNFPYSQTILIINWEIIAGETTSAVPNITSYQLVH